MEKAATAVPAGPSANEPRQTVLVVDDEEGLRTLVCRTLRAEGYGTLEAAHGAEALEVIEQAAEPVDLVVTDVVMPDENVFDVLPSTPVARLCSGP